jgi:hypothetical protein
LHGAPAAAYGRRYSYPTIPEDSLHHAALVELIPDIQIGLTASNGVDLNADDTDWATRSNMWQAGVKKVSARRTK